MIDGHLPPIISRSCIHELRGFWRNRHSFTSMEAALVSGLLKLAGVKLLPLISSEFASIMGVKKDLCELERLFREITSRLSAVGDKITDRDPSFYWLKDLKDVAYDFDDLLYRLEAEKYKVDMDGNKHDMASWFCAKPKSALSRLEMAQEIKKIKKRFAEIVKQRTDVNAITNSLVAEQPLRHVNKTIGEMSILVNIDETKVFGRDEVRHKIVSKLVNSNTQEKISVISIVGLGGSGKTTLAKYICQDNKIMEHFESTWWIHVSKESDVEKLIGKLFESVANEKSELHTLQHMSRIISERLSETKFLLVFDDVWNGDQHEWEQFEQHFNRGAPGSKILLTTRDGKVAEVVKSAEIFNLAFLSDGDSWKLCQQSSGWAEEGLDSEFIEVGKEIVKKCAGVPIAIKSLGGVLRNKRHIREWRALRDSDLLNDLDIKDRVLGSLRLSYFHLSDNLKQCFLLCSIFPKGYFIYKDDLISLWTAHGFVNPRIGGQLPEDVGSDYFDSLLKVSFLQDLVEDQHTGQLLCNMHDLVHDLTRQILQNEIILTSTKNTNDHSPRCIYLSLTSCTDKVDSKLFSKVRSLYASGDTFATNKPIRKSCSVRSAILEDINDTSIPLLIPKFEYLAYLRISGANCREIPEAITGCWNLQALYIIYCFKLAMLPESIGNLKRLKILELSWVVALVSLPQSIGDCQSLESLHLIKCGQLREIPESIAKNEMLRVLNIVNCSYLCQLPSESLGILRNLRAINLTGCVSLEDLPSSFACDELHTLKLTGLTRLRVLPQCITLLSNLEHLDLGYCNELVELPEGIGNLKRLEVLNIEGCRSLWGMPAGFGKLTRLRKLFGLFVVGDTGEDARISELGDLDRLSGLLEIEGIRCVKDPYDAEKAYLKGKHGIQKLKLNWLSWENWIETSTEEDIDMERELRVLNALEPPSVIKELEILNYHGLHLPCWMTNGRHNCTLDIKSNQTVDLPHFPHLTGMVLYHFPKLKHLSRLVGLPLLKTLKLSECDSLESISAGPFPSLRELNISKMYRLLELSTMTRIILADDDRVTQCRNQEVQCCFPHLSTLHIEYCPKLNVKPWFPASLESLTLERSNGQLLFPGSSVRSVHSVGDESEPHFFSNTNGVSYSSLLKELRLQRLKGSSSGSGWESIGHLTALKSLEIEECSELMQLPDSIGNLSSLLSLRILSCENLMELPEGIQHLNSLQELHILQCGSFHKLPEAGIGGLRSLRSLRVEFLPALSCLPRSIRGLSSLTYLQIHFCTALHRLPGELWELRSLQTLEIFGLSALTCLPESMECLTSIRTIDIGSCDALTELPKCIGQLSTLRSLRIHYCRALASLPCSIQDLAALQELDIARSPHLARRCKQGSGEDWHLISHIPHVNIINDD